MKTLRRTCTVTILCMAVAASALAGQIDSTGVVTPPPPPAPSLLPTVILTIIGLIR